MSHYDTPPELYDGLRLTRRDTGGAALARADALRGPDRSCRLSRTGGRRRRSVRGHSESIPELAAHELASTRGSSPSRHRAAPLRRDALRSIRQRPARDLRVGHTIVEGLTIRSDAEHDFAFRTHESAGALTQNAGRLLDEPKQPTACRATGGYPAIAGSGQPGGSLGTKRTPTSRRFLCPRIGAFPT